MADLADQFKDARNMNAVQAVDKGRGYSEKTRTTQENRKNLTSKRQRVKSTGLYLNLNGRVICVIGLAT